MNTQEMMYAMLDGMTDESVALVEENPEFTAIVLDWRKGAVERRAQAFIALVNSNPQFVAEVVYNAGKSLIPTSQFENGSRSGAYLGTDPELAQLIAEAYKLTKKSGGPIGLMAFKDSRP